jgi:glycosyltransferase involved in cell wall biosynthesis
VLLLTTPDYPPKWGGLTTHTLNVEKVLRALGVRYELFHWRSVGEIATYPREKLRSFDRILNIHSGFHMHMPAAHPRVINFINGAEILFYSPNPVKRFVKRALKHRGLGRISGAQKNIFISEFTFQTLQRQGHRPDYARDIVFPMCVETAHGQFHQKEFDRDPLRFICVARDVPHKNFRGAIELCEEVQRRSRRPVELVTVTDKVFSSPTIAIRSHVNPDDGERDRLLADAHFNLLLSLDHSHRGFFEGFGQIVQEAGCLGTPSVVLNTGGLPESVHDGETGWVLPDAAPASVARFWGGLTAQTYARVARRCFEHTMEAHGLENWKRLFGTIL